jgi:hypothetical protein
LYSTKTRGHDDPTAMASAIDEIRWNMSTLIKYVAGSMLGLACMLSGPGRGDSAPKTTFTPQEFGAKCDGVSNDTASLAAFLKAVSASAETNGKAEGIVRGMCKTTAIGIAAKSGMSLSGAGGSSGFICVAAKTRSKCLAISGGSASGPRLTITADVAKDSTELTVSDAGTLRAGDYITLTYEPTDLNYVTQGQLNKVRAIAGNTLTLVYPIPFPIQHAHITSVQKHTITENVSITNLVFDGTHAGGAQFGLYVHDIARGVISSVHSRGFAGASASGGMIIGPCDQCAIADLTDEGSGSPDGGHGMSFNLVNHSDLRNLTEINGAAFGIVGSEVTSSRFSNMRVDGSWGRAFKFEGSTGNTLRKVNVRHGNPADWIAFGLARGSSYNDIYDLTASEANTCVWLNGESNWYNRFDGVTTSRCHIGYKGGGGSIWVAKTPPGDDVGNTFVNVDPAAKPQVSVQGTNTSISYRRKPIPPG